MRRRGMKVQGCYSEIWTVERLKQELGGVGPAGSVVVPVEGGSAERVWR